MSAHIIIIAPDSDEVSRWSDTVIDWFDRYLPEEQPDLFLLCSCDSVMQTLTAPLSVGESPSLIVVDHALDPTKVPHLVSAIRSAIPESWLIEIVNDNTVISSEPDTVAVQRPLSRTEWAQLLQQTMIDSRSPQWSRALFKESGL